MQADIKKIDAVKREVTLTIPAEQVDKEYRVHFNQSAGMVQVPGFRKGKAPMAMVERSHGTRIREYFVEMMTETKFREAAQEHKLEYLLMPEVTKVDWEPGTDMTIKLEVETEPEFTISQIEGLTVPYKPFSLEADVQKYLEELRDKGTILIDVEDDIKVGDEVELEIRHASDPNGKAWTCKTELTSEDDDLLTPLLSRKIGDTAEAELTDERFSDLSGEEEVTPDPNDHYLLMVNAIQRKQIPEIDDDFAKDHEFDDLADMKTKIAAELTLMNEHKNIYVRHSAILSKILRDNRFELPEKVLNHLVKQEMQRYSRIKEPQFRRYLEYQVHYEIMKDMVKIYLLKNLFAQYPHEVTEDDKQRFYEHLAILSDTTVEAWKEKNKEDLEQNKFDESIQEFAVMHRIAATCDFVEKADEPEEEQGDEYEVMPSEELDPSRENEIASSPSSLDSEDINANTNKEDA
ncbi:MAG: hypothetical protein FJ042_01145 [Candidatus Cloacimonetes bacterium]|nr:hypothetical protein [Candidatus Cloacimonadota bacterium]